MRERERESTSRFLTATAVLRFNLFALENSICLFSFSCAYRFRQLTLSASRFACRRGSACQAHVRKRVSDRIIHTNSETALNARHLEVRFGRQLFFSVFPLIPLIRVAASSSRVDRQNVNPSVTSLRMSFVIANLDSRGRKRSGTRVRSSRSDVRCMEA